MKISVKNVSKIYNSHKPQCKFIGGLFGIHEPKFVLKNISFEISDGECVGIIGSNGSGKSTLLKLICNITSPTEGEIQAGGKISSLLELGTGFNPEYTGISNIYLNGTIQGLSRAEIKAIIPEIIEFADIGDYINMPVKTYSDGMFLRLAFACAVAIEPDILIVDEALAVGDFAFRQKCFAKISEMKKNGTTIIMVSHDIDCIRRFCERAIWIEGGILRMDSDVMSVSSSYMEYMTGGVGDKNESVGRDEKHNCVNRFGSAIGSVLSVEAPKILRTGESARIVCKINIPENAELNTLSFSISVKNVFGLDVTVISTADNNIRFTKTGRKVIETQYVCELCAGEYSICAALEDRASKPIKYYDYAEGIASFKVVSDEQYFGVFHTPAEINIQEGGGTDAQG